MTIAIDIDDVLADFFPSFISYYNSLHKTNYAKNQFHTNNWWEIVGGTPAEVIGIAYRDFAYQGKMRHLEVFSGAVAAINKIKKNHKLIIVTGRAKEISRDTDYWLTKHFSGCFNDIHFIRSEILKPEIESKYEICKKVGANIMIEDDDNNVRHFTEEGIKVILFDQPWNQSIKSSKSIARVNSWENIVEEINNCK